MPPSTPMWGALRNIFFIKAGLKGCNPVWGFTGACPRDTFHAPENAE